MNHATAQHTPFSQMLKTWRNRRRLSQLGLATSAQMSQRHISFLETGRSNPSRYAIWQLGEALDMPAAEIDAMLLAAGFAARSTTAQWSPEVSQAVDAALAHVLQGHAPYPAMVVDHRWTVQQANPEALAFFARLGMVPPEDGNAPNLLAGILLPGPIRDSILNWPDVARAMMRLFELECARVPSDTEAHEMQKAFLAAPGVADAINAPISTGPAPVLSIDFDLNGQKLSMFSLIATVGMSIEANLQNLRIETLMPADDATRAWFLDS